MKIKVQFGLSPSPDNTFDAVSLWVNDNKIASELVRINLPFYKTRLEMTKKNLIKRFALHLYEEGEVDLTNIFI